MPDPDELVILDENIEVTDMWRRLNHLVPEPQCSTGADRIIEWHDVRPQPSRETMAAVDLADVEVSEQDAADEQGNVPSQRHLIRFMWKMFNNIRVLEGKQPVAWKVFVKQMRTET